jgi:hypothetical protein
MKTIARMLPCCCLALAACGGGGGGGDSQSPAPVAPGFKLTSSNAPMVAAKTWQASSDSAAMGDIAGSSGILGLKPGSRKAAPGVVPTTSLANILLKIPISPETTPCQVSGAITISGELEDLTTLTSGDVIAVEADACDDGLGEVTDGTIVMTIVSFAGDLPSGAYDIAMTLELSDFQVTTANDVQTSNGELSVSLDTMAVPMVAAEVRGSSLVLDTNKESSLQVDFAHRRTLDGALQPAPYTLSISGTLDSTSLPGSVDYSTPVTFTGLGAAHPTTGTLLLEGENSSARLVALDEVSVLIEIDADGDGDFEESIETTWQAIVEENG